MRIHSGFVVAATFAAILVAPRISTAKDLCIDASGGSPSVDNPIVIGRRFKIPKSNKCGPFQGVLVGGYPSAVTGVACTSFDSDHVTFTLTATVFAPAGGIGGAYGAQLNLATLTGYFTVFHPSGTSSTLASGYDCHTTYPDNL